ncbi:heavy metal-associated isoprenylated plant protein 30-like [Canna indica]|uniref:Heavy metal-associated isoprenylated plant protein 30-like n=1 Tax=Canna indica TaxID=4628 RepID=A0AAQ3QDQ5_9LILI|nr:heavy metal-associated isoprenylated plant protein 30-like [Canna indica]
MARLQIVPADQKHVEAQYVEMKVPLYSYCCEKKVKKALSHLRGIHSVHVDYNLQKVTVWGICNRDDVLATIRKKRREARFWETTTAAECEAGKPPPPPPKVEADEILEEDAARDHVAAVKSRKLRKSWKKKLFPLALY